MWDTWRTDSRTSEARRPCGTQISTIAVSPWTTGDQNGSPAGRLPRFEVRKAESNEPPAAVGSVGE